MGKTRQDELIDAQTPVGQEFVNHLLWTNVERILEAWHDHCGE